MRIVFDTGILISACIYPDRQPASVYLSALRRYSLVASSQTIDELRTVLGRPKFDRWRDTSERQAWFEQYLNRVRLIRISEHITDCLDPNDNKFLDLAIASDARVIVASDPHLVSMSPYNSIEIVGVNDFKNKYLL